MIITSKLLRALALLYFLLFSTNILGQDRFVSTTGSDGGNDCSNAGSPCLTIQRAIDQAVASDVIGVAAGTYRENLLITKSITLQGSNSGVSGFGTRGTETILQPGTTDLIDGIVVTIAASDVTLDGFTVTGDNDLLTGPGGTAFDALEGIILNATTTNFSNITITNNIFEDFPRDNRSVMSGGMEQVDFIDGTATILSAAVSLQGSSSFESIGHQVSNNLFRNIDDQPDADYSDFLGYGILFANQIYPDITDNRFENVGGGILALNIPKMASSDSLVMNSCFFDGSKAGILVFNGTTNLTANDMTIQNSVGFGVRIVGVGNNDNIDFYLTNSSITETGNALSNYSGLASETFSGTGVSTVRIDSCTISDNQNRGLTFRGNDMVSTNIGSVNNSVLEGNAYNRNSAGNGFGIIVNAGAEVTVSETFLNNASASRTATAFDALIGANSGGPTTANGGLITVNSSSMIASSGTITASVSGAGTAAMIDASGNWWGVTDEASIVSATVGTDFTPWLNSGTDQNSSRAGFQGDFNVLNAGVGGVQTGSAERIQEAIDALTADGTVIIHAGTFNETPVISANLTLQTIGNVSLDQLTMNGTGIVLTVDGSFSVDGSINLTDGNIMINNGSSITLNNGASDIMESSNSRIEGTLAYEPFTLLSGSSISLLGINFISGNNDLINLSIGRTSGSQGQNVDGMGNESIGITWQLTADNSPDNWTINFSWPMEFDNGNPLTNLTIWRNGGAGFEEVVTSLSASGNPRVTDNFVINSFSDYTVADVTVLLPVTLEDFRVFETVSGTALLEWATLTEENADFFQVEKSLDGETFFEVGVVQANGNSTVRRSYEFEDRELAGTDLFYRLKTVDFDGSYEYSPIVFLNTSSRDVYLYPNPANDFVLIPLADKVDAHLTLYSQTGSVLMDEKMIGQRLDIKGLSNGLYFYQLKVGNLVIPGKLIVE